MALIRFAQRPELWNPWSELERIRQGLDKLSLGYPDFKMPFGTNVFPALNIVEEEETVIVKAEIPGVRREDLEISLEGDALTIRGRREVRHEEEKVSFHRREIESGSFSRAVTLPVKINPDTVNARLENGILTVTLEKAAEMKPRRIAIETA